MDDAELKELFRRAVEIAKAVPEEFQQIAFNRALDSLLGPTTSGRDVRGAIDVASVRKKTVQTSKPSPARQKRGSGRPAPKAALLELKQAGYFATKRTIKDVRDYLEKKRGHKYTLQDLSPALLRLVRDGELDRDKNAEGQYEYKAV
jgi:hypothetical protein